MWPGGHYPVPENVDEVGLGREKWLKTEPED